VKALVDFLQAVNRFDRAVAGAVVDDQHRNPGQGIEHVADVERDVFALVQRRGDDDRFRFRFHERAPPPGKLASDRLFERGGRFV
jgi:hypothetical protein